MIGLLRTPFLAEKIKFKSAKGYDADLQVVISDSR